MAALLESHNASAPSLAASASRPARMRSSPRTTGRDPGSVPPAAPTALRWEPSYGKICERQSVAQHPSLAFQGVVKHRCEAAEVLLPTRDENRVGWAEAKHILRTLLVCDHAARLGVTAGIRETFF